MRKSAISSAFRGNACTRYKRPERAPRQTSHKEQKEEALMPHNTCPRCGASLDFGERCDCGAPGSVQKRIDAEREAWLRRSAPEARLGAALYALKSGIHSANLIDYSRYKNIRQVPEAELEPLTRALRAEKHRQEVLGIEKHQALRGLGAKIAECRRLLDDLELEYYETQRLGENITWGGFYQLIDQKLCGETANIEPAAPPKEPEAEQVTLGEVMRYDGVHKTG